MEQKDYILIAFSGTALTISIISLIITLIQKNKETKRTIRKTITDNLESIAKANIELNKLRAQKDTDFNSDYNIAIRRNVNSQKRVVLSNAKYLIDRNLDIATESDCNLMAGAFTDIGDFGMAEHYWKITLQKSRSPEILIMNLRGFGMFKFAKNEIEEARELFKKADKINLTESDSHFAIKCDTQLMLSDFEINLDKKRYENCLTNSMEYLSKIKNTNKQNEMQERVRRKIAKYKAERTT